jgi:hypothetical protein
MPGAALLTATLVALVNELAPAMAVTAKVYEYSAVSVKVKVMLGGVPDVL